MSSHDFASWRDIAVLPVFGVTVTVVAYLIAVRLHRRGRGHPLLNPTLVAIIIVAAAIRTSGLPYAAYAQSATVVSFMLSPAVVLLAVPLYRRRAVIRASSSDHSGCPSSGSSDRDRQCGRHRLATWRRSSHAPVTGAEIHDRGHCDRHIGKDRRRTGLDRRAGDHDGDYRSSPGAIADAMAGRQGRTRTGPVDGHCLTRHWNRQGAADRRACRIVCRSGDEPQRRVDGDPAANPPQTDLRVSLSWCNRIIVDSATAASR